MEHQEIRPVPKIPAYKIPVHAVGLLKNPLKAIHQMTTQYGDIFALPLYKKSQIVFVNHPDYVKHFLKDSQDAYSRGKAVKQSAITGLDKFLGNGIFMSDGDDWEAQHKLLKGLFSTTAIESTLPIIEEELGKLTQKWQSQIEQNPLVNVEHDLNILMLRIMLRTQICANKTFDDHAIYEALTGRMEASSVKSLFWFQLKSSLLKPFGKNYQYKKHDQYLAKLENIAFGLVEDLIAHKYQPNGLFQLLLADYEQNKITKTNIRDQFMNFVFAAFDTTATAITWTLYNLAANTNVQQKVRQELQQSLELIPHKHLAQLQLPFLQMVMKESLRLYPPVWSYAREAASDDVVNGFQIHAKSIVVISSYSLHRHPKYWQSGNEFDPSNFEKEQFKGKNFAYIPFGQGKRMCIGRALADYQMQIIVGSIINQFELTTNNNVQPSINANIIIKALEPLRLRLNRITDTP